MAFLHICNRDGEKSTGADPTSSDPRSTSFQLRHLRTPAPPTLPSWHYWLCSMRKYLILLWLQWQECTTYLSNRQKIKHKKTKEQKENRKYFRANQSEDVSSPAPSNPTTSCGKTYTPTFFIVSGSFRCFCSLLFTYGSLLMTTLVTINVHIYVSWKITFKSELAFSSSYFNR